MIADLRWKEVLLRALKRAAETLEFSLLERLRTTPCEYAANRSVTWDRP